MQHENASWRFFNWTELRIIQLEFNSMYLIMNPGTFGLWFFVQVEYICNFYYGQIDDILVVPFAMLTYIELPIGTYTGMYVLVPTLYRYIGHFC